MFFFEKKNKRLLSFGVPVPASARAKEQKCLLLFFRKEDLTYHESVLT
jgi:hypothetical protein